MIVVDAGVLVTALVDDAEDGRRVRARLADEVLVAPSLVDLEVASVVRRHVLRDELHLDRARQALDDLVALPLRRVPHRPLLDRVWELRHHLTVYDAAYVTAAELFEVSLLTADARLAAAPGLRCAVEVL